MILRLDSRLVWSLDWASLDWVEDGDEIGFQVWVSVRIEVGIEIVGVEFEFLVTINQSSPE